MNCKEVSEYVLQENNRNFSLSKKLWLKVHLLMCKPCLNFKKQMNRLESIFLKVDLSDESERLTDAEKEVMKSEFDKCIDP